MRPRVIGGVAVAAALAFALGGGPAEAAPTCADTLGIEVHGQHIVGDYVVGGGTEWPPRGGIEVGGGAEIPGGPGPGFHFPNDFAPGASFCVGSRSPGTHL